MIGGRTRWRRLELRALACATPTNVNLRRRSTIHRKPLDLQNCIAQEFRPRRNKESERDYVKKLTSEFCIASALRQPNIVETVDLMQDNEGKWCVVMEFCPGGDLYNAIRKGGMSPAEVECSFKQILTGVGYLHAQGVAHRDLKPENIFFDAKGQIKVRRTYLTKIMTDTAWQIGDFGASTVFRLPWEQTIHKSGGLCGSEPYIAPEQFAQPGRFLGHAL